MAKAIIDIVGSNLTANYDLKRNKNNICFVIFLFGEDVGMYDDKMMIRIVQLEIIMSLYYLFIVFNYSYMTKACFLIVWLKVTWYSC